jgi:transposase
MYRKTGSSLRKCARRLNYSKRYLEKGKKISASTINRHLKKTKWGRKAYKKLTKPLLSQKNIEDRKKFGEKLQKEGFLDPGRLGQEKRRGILFTDETWIELNRKTSFYRTEEKKDVPFFLKPKKGVMLMAAGGFCSRGVSELHIVAKGQTVDGNYYRGSILPIYFDALDSTTLFPNKRKIVFQQDGAPSHTANLTMQMLDNKAWTTWGKGVWPGNSPDLNPIENLWSILKNSAYEEPVPTNLDMLVGRFRRKWFSLPLELLEKLSESLKNRVEEMLRNDGGHTRY